MALKRTLGGDYVVGEPSSFNPATPGNIGTGTPGSGAFTNVTTTGTVTENGNRVATLGKVVAISRCAYIP